MPLTHDDIPGSWASYSVGWPTIHCKDKEAARRAYVACTKEAVVPYGSFVLVGNDLRVESHSYLSKLQKHLEETKIKSSDEVIEIYERSRRGAS